MQKSEAERIEYDRQKLEMIKAAKHAKDMRIHNAEAAVEARRLLENSTMNKEERYTKDINSRYYYYYYYSTTTTIIIINIIIINIIIIE